MAVAIGRGRDQAHAAGSSPVWRVQDGLSVGDVVNGGDASMHDADVFLNDFDHRRNAIGGATGRCDNGV